MTQTVTHEAKDQVAYWRARALRAEGWTSAAEHDSHQDMFVLLDARSVVGNTPLFWMPNGNGYGSVVNEIGRYPKDEAFRKRDTDVPIPVEVAVMCARPRIDIQLLNRERKLRNEPPIIIGGSGPRRRRR